MTRTCSRLLMVSGGQNKLLSEPNSSRTSTAPTQRPLRKLDLPQENPCSPPGKNRLGKHVGPLAPPPLRASLPYRRPSAIGHVHSIPSLCAMGHARAIH